MNDIYPQYVSFFIVENEDKFVVSFYDADNYFVQKFVDKLFLYNYNGFMVCLKIEGNL